MNLLFLVLTLAQPISDVRVEGNLRVTDDAILHHASVSRVDDAPAAFRRLWDTGLFEDVRFELEDGVLVIHVVEKPLLGSFRFEGERIPTEELIEALALRPGRPFGETDRLELEAHVQDLLGDEVRVTATTSAPDGGLVDLVVSVERIERATIQRIVFVGNDAISDAELLHAMESKERSFTTWLTGSDRLDPRRLQEDTERIRDLYRSRGYLDAVVGPIEMGPTVTVPIAEGRRYRLESITVEPGSLLTEEQVSDWLPEAGVVLDATAIDRVVTRLERYYQSRGYPRVAVVRERDVEGDLVRVRLRVDEGSFLRVGTITFRGHRRHRDRDLRQHLDLAESDRFDQSQIERDVQSVSRLETIANVVPEIDLDARPGRADVVYRVQEVDRFEYLVGGGVNGVQGGTGNGQLIAKSLLGRGDVWRLDLDLGNRFQNVAAGYRDPSTLGHRLFFGVDFARASLTFPDETSEDTLDLAFRVGGPQGSRWQFLGGIRVAHFTLGTEVEGFVPFLTPYLGERFRTQRASFLLAYEARDQPVFPTRGTGAQMGVELVTGDVEVARVRAQLSRLFRLSRRNVLGFSARVEGVWPFGSTDTDGLPRFERLFLGSENDMRGFAIRGVGPRDADVVVGGDRLAYATAEYQFVAHPRLRLVGFFDAGNVWAQDFDGVPLPDLRYDVGAEIQLLAPVWNLPLRLGFGRNLEPVLDENDGRFFFTFAVRF